LSASQSMQTQSPSVSLASLRSRLAAHQPVERTQHNLKPAAVLVLVIERTAGSQLEVLFIRRADGTDIHAGQVAFPGGSCEVSDADAWQTALREASEEVGLPAERVECIGRLNDYQTITDFHVSPFVGVIHGEFEVVPDPIEVAEVFRVPLDALLTMRMDTHTWEHIPGVRFQVFRYGDQVIWGATAEMLKSFLSLLGRTENL